MAKKTKAKPITAAEFDAKVERGEDITPHLDLDSAVKPVNVDFPLWMVNALDTEAQRLGVARTALIKIWIDDRLKSIGQAKGA